MIRFGTGVLLTRNLYISMSSMFFLCSCLRFISNAIDIQAVSGRPFRSFWWGAIQRAVDGIVLQFFGAANFGPLMVFVVPKEMSVASGVAYK